MTEEEQQDEMDTYDWRADQAGQTDEDIERMIDEYDQRIK